MMNRRQFLTALIAGLLSFFVRAFFNAPVEEKPLEGDTSSAAICDRVLSADEVRRQYLKLSSPLMDRLVVASLFKEGEWIEIRRVDINPLMFRVRVWPAAEEREPT